MQAYCMKCRKKVEMKNSKATTLKNKRATQGSCPLAALKCSVSAKARTE